MGNKVHAETIKSVHDPLNHETIIRPHEENHLFDMLAIAPIWTVFFVLI
ncbi:MAG: hypothetical protein H6936_03580 [Burkholderiales bacterium]|nr:hypothetical protein [Nitrosomonas sp.]MCP5273934.1 hypothetical protein [Burkholderiales bacterium]